jgi:hypothetical protein
MTLPLQLILGDLYGGDMYDMMSAILTHFQDFNKLEPMCAYESQLDGNYNNESQLQWLKNFSLIWEMVEERQHKAFCYSQLRKRANCMKRRLTADCDYDCVSTGAFFDDMQAFDTFCRHNLGMTQDDLDQRDFDKATSHEVVSIALTFALNWK